MCLICFPSQRLTYLPSPSPTLSSMVALCKSHWTKKKQAWPSLTLSMGYGRGVGSCTANREPHPQQWLAPHQKAHSMAGECRSGKDPLNGKSGAIMHPSTRNPWLHSSSCLDSHYLASSHSTETLLTRPQQNPFKLIKLQLVTALCMHLTNPSTFTAITPPFKTAHYKNPTALNNANAHCLIYVECTNS